MNIHIFYSHMNVSGTDYKVRPQWFDFEKCFQNLLHTVKNYPNVKLYVIMDGNIDDNWISKYKEYFIGHNIVGGSMEAAAMEMYKIAYSLLDDMDENDILYFLENDYLHLDNWVEYVLNLYQSFEGLSYISLYDHNDKYFLPIYHDLVSLILTTDTNHWRTTPSTCGSYLVYKKVFQEDYLDHTTVIGDHNKWLYLSQTKERSVLTPIPGLSTHCMEGLLSPTINWKQIINNK